jgi:adenylate cyclase
MSMGVFRGSSFPFAVGLAGCIFLVDTLSSLQFAVASLYAVVILIVAHDLGRKGVILTGTACALLTVLGYLLMHGLAADTTAPLRSVVSLAAISTTTFLVLRTISANQRVKTAERQRANLTRFFSPSIVDQLVDIQVPFSFARCQPAAVLFADMVGFTAHSSDKSPDLVIGMLRDLLRLLSEAVFSHHGSIDKFLGDGLMAFFGPPLPSTQDVTNAAACALEIVRSVELWNQRRACTNGEAVRIAIGIHYGKVLQGDVGTEKRLELTLIGDTVNVASRVEAYCRSLNASVLVTGEFMQALIEEGSADLAKAFTDEGLHVLRGRKEPIHLFGVIRGPRDVTQRMERDDRSNHLADEAG